jgi:NADH:ubiquinone oxidoreductase subunit 2 (subunit N)
MALVAISLAGLPPLVFFFPKFAVIAVIILQDSWLLSFAVLSLVMLG